MGAWVRFNGDARDLPGGYPCIVDHQNILGGFVARTAGAIEQHPVCLAGCSNRLAINVVTTFLPWVSLRHPTVCIKYHSEPYSCAEPQALYLLPLPAALCLEVTLRIMASPGTPAAWSMSLVEYGKNSDQGDAGGGEGGDVGLPQGQNCCLLGWLLLALDIPLRLHTTV